MGKEEKKYKLSEWGCLLVTLHDYNIDVSHITPVMGQHMVEDFLKTMEKAGYIAKANEEEDGNDNHAKQDAAKTAQASD